MLHQFEPPASDDEMRDASLQFVRKVSGFAHPSAVNQAAFDRAVADVTATVHQLLATLVTTGKPKNRELEAAKARQRALKRFGGAA